MTHTHRSRFPQSHRHPLAPAGAPSPGTASCRAQTARPAPDERAVSPWPQTGATTDAGTRLSIRQSVPGEWVVDLLQALAGRVDVTSLCRKTGIAYDRLHDVPHRVPCDGVLQMLEDAADLSGDPLIAIHLAEEMEPRSVPVYLARTQRTVREALRQLCRFQHLLWLGLPLIVVERGSSQLLITLPSSPRRESRHLTELFLASIFLEAQRMLGQPLHIEEVRLRHRAAGPRTEYERVFAGPVRFDQTEDALCFPGAVFDYRVPTSNPSIAAFIERAARESAPLPGQLSFQERAWLAIRSALLSRLSCEHQPIAYDLGVSSATMRRRLYEEHADFAEVKTSVQRELAAQLLAVPVLSLDEVAARCGFRDAFGFSAAFTRWTGLSPAGYRKETD